jgi:hypothetical protein
VPLIAPGAGVCVGGGGEGAPRSAPASKDGPGGDAQDGRRAGDRSRPLVCPHVPEPPAPQLPCALRSFWWLNSADAVRTGRPPVKLLAEDLGTTASPAAS